MKIRRWYLLKLKFLIISTKFVHKLVNLHIRSEYAIALFQTMFGAASSPCQVWIVDTMLVVISRHSDIHYNDGYMGQVTKCGCLVTWFCYQMIAKPDNKTAAPSWPEPYIFFEVTQWWREVIYIFFDVSVAIKDFEYDFANQMAYFKMAAALWGWQCL